jgi:hypothetical protein
LVICVMRIVSVLCCQVFELDREIQDYKEKIELYRAKLQEIVSNCTAMGNRLLC